ncbi:MAG: flagellar filament capping protein FliD [Deltaproteobacteria bacterium]|nr:flagellar filament capping protein FliD [Deltaproteobacteria bacterium]
MAITLSGLASGMDTQSVIDKIMTVAKQPLVDLQNQQADLTAKKTLFTSLNKQLLSLNDAALNLRLQSTWESMTANSSNQSAVTATAQVGASPGMHTVSISQVAQAATTGSQYVNAILSANAPNTANFTTITGRPPVNLEGDHNITISNTGGVYSAVDTFTGAGGGGFQTLTGSSAGSASVSGTIGTTISSQSNNNVLDVTVDGTEAKITLDPAVANTTSLAQVAAGMETKLNAAMNQAKQTTDVAYVAVRSVPGSGAGDKGKFVIYDTTPGSQSNISVNYTGSSAAGALGFTAAGDTASASSSITTQINASGYSQLLNQMNDPVTGLIRGVSFGTSTSGIMAGTARVTTTAAISASEATSTTVVGATGASSGSLNTTVMGLQNAGLATAPSSATNGTFTINGQQISIQDYQSMSVNDVLAMINSSGANVTATYDSTRNQFDLTNTLPGSTAITVGATGDTSDFLTLAKLTDAAGATQTAGVAAGSLSADSPLVSAGLKITPSTGTFTINGVTLYVSPNSDTINTLITKINNSGANVKASFDPNSEKFTLTSYMDTVKTNTQRITLGSADDTSNILQALNLQEPDSATLTGTAGNAAHAAETITVTPENATTGSKINISAVSQSGAYQATPGQVNFTDGIQAGTTIYVSAGTNGSTLSTWTNNTGSTIKDINSFVKAWNDSSKWNNGTVPVGVVKEGDSSLRFFNMSSGANASFSMYSTDQPDSLSQLGLTSKPLGEVDETDEALKAPADKTRLALYHFNSDGTAGQAVDATGQGNNGVITGATSTTTGAFSNALQFNAAGDNVLVNNNPVNNLNGKTAFSAEAWVNPTAGGSTDRVLIDKTGGGANGFKVTMNAGNQMVFTVQTASGTHTLTAPAGSTPAASQWSQVAVTYDGTQATNQMKIYVNGTMVAQGNAGAAGESVVDSGANMVIGNSSALTNGFNGQVDELGLYNQALSDKEIEAHANRGVYVGNGASSSNTSEYNALRFASDVNSSGAGVTATTNGSGGISVVSSTAGHTGGFSLADDAASGVNLVAGYFGSSSVKAEAPAKVAMGTAGLDAAFTVDGVSYTRASNSVSNIIPKVTLNLRNKTTATESITLKTNTDQAISKLSDFIAQYNNMIQTLNPPYLDDTQKTYLTPLTTTQQSSMTYDQITTYNNNHDLYKGYTFIQSDSSLKRLYSSLRSITTNAVTGLDPSCNSLSMLGISPGSVSGYNDEKAGYLLFAPDGTSSYADNLKQSLQQNNTLLSQLQANPDKVYQLFANDSTKLTGSTDGLARQLDTALGTYTDVGGFLQSQITTNGTIDQNITQLTTRISDLQTRLDAQQSTLQSKFNAMETAISQLNSQAAAMSSLTGATSSSSSKTG